LYAQRQNNIKAKPTSLVPNKWASGFYGKTKIKKNNNNANAHAKFKQNKI